MDNARELRVEKIFQRAIDMPIEQRAEFLEGECGRDEEIRRRVEKLLRHVDHLSPHFLEAPRNTASREASSREDGQRESPRSDPAQLWIPDWIGRYRILRSVGYGGMGVVYLAEQRSPKRTVALKTLRSPFLTKRVVSRFRREIRILARLQHPGIAQIYEAGEVETPLGKLPFFAMEYVRGESLTEFVLRHNQSLRDRMQLLAEVCDTVDFAHRQGVLHRDLKPANILVELGSSGGSSSGETNRDRVDEQGVASTSSSVESGVRFGRPKVLDFGVGRIAVEELDSLTLETEQGEIIGTLPYMSPEQISGRSEDLDERADVYSLGVIAFQVLTGQLPFSVAGLSVPEAARVICEVDHRRLGSFDGDLRGDLEAIVHKAIKREKERRYESAADLGEDIRRYLSSRPIHARVPSTVYQLRQFAQRNKAVVSGVVATLIALTVGLVVSVSFGLGTAKARHSLRGGC